MRYVVKLSALMAKGHIDPGDIDGWRTIPAGEGEGGARVPIKRVSGGGGELTWRVHPNFTPENAGKDFAQVKEKTFTTSGEELKKAHEIAKQIAENTKDPEKKAHAERHAKTLEEAIKPKAENPTQSKAEQVARLVKMGGKRWQKGSMDRIYMDAPKFYGLDVGYYNTGNVSYAELDGKKISNAMAREIINQLASAKVWFDVSSGQFESKGLDERSEAKIISAIRASM